MIQTKRDFFTIAGVMLVAVALIGFWMGRQTITLSDLSQQRARDISVAVYQECDRNFSRDAMGLSAIAQASNRCHNVADVALEEMYAAGVSPVDEVMERAKEMARKAGKQ